MNFDAVIIYSWFHDTRETDAVARFRTTALMNSFEQNFPIDTSMNYSFTSKQKIRGCDDFHRLISAPINFPIPEIKHFTRVPSTSACFSLGVPIIVPQCRFNYSMKAEESGEFLHARLFFLAFVL